MTTKAVFVFLFAGALSLGCTGRAPDTTSSSGAAKADNSTTGDPTLPCSTGVDSFCSTADGKTLVLSTAVNRESETDGFDGFTTRSDCADNKVTVNGVDLGARALVGSLYISNQDGFTVIDQGQKGAKVKLTTYWKIDLRSVNAPVDGGLGVAEVRLQVGADKTTAYLVGDDGTFREVAISCH
jgi:hypothetical protein